MVPAYLKAFEVELSNDLRDDVNDPLVQNRSCETLLSRNGRTDDMCANNDHKIGVINDPDPQSRQ